MLKCGCTNFSCMPQISHPPLFSIYVAAHVKKQKEKYENAFASWMWIQGSISCWYVIFSVYSKIKSFTKTANTIAHSYMKH